MSNQRVTTIISIVFGFLAMIFLIVAGSFWIELNNVKARCVPTEAIIVEIDRWAEDTMYEYQVNSTTFYIYSNSYDSSAEIGDIETIYYNPSNPSEAYFLMDSIIFILTFGIVGSSFLVVVVILITSGLITRRKEAVCREQGRLIRTKILTYKSTATSYNSKLGYRIVCEGNIDGLKTTFRSHIIYLNPHEVPNEPKIVQVYVINPKKYFVDTDSVRDASEYDWLGENY